MRFATSAEATWPGNFRDLNAAVTRMATLAAGGRITVAIVEEELERLRGKWQRGDDDGSESILERHLSREQREKIDPFDRGQLAEVLQTCEAGRGRFGSGAGVVCGFANEKGWSNDADRLRKYLARFGLEWKNLRVGE